MSDCTTWSLIYSNFSKNSSNARITASREFYFSKTTAIRPIFLERCHAEEKFPASRMPLLSPRSLYRPVCSHPNFSRLRRSFGIFISIIVQIAFLVTILFKNGLLCHWRYSVFTLAFNLSLFNMDLEVYFQDLNF